MELKYILTTSTQLQIPIILMYAQITHLFCKLHQHSLLSIRQLCDAGCEAVFPKQAVDSTLDNQPVLGLQRENST